MAEKFRWIRGKIESMRGKKSKAPEAVVFVPANTSQTNIRSEFVYTEPQKVPSEQSRLFLQGVEDWNKENEKNPKGSLGMTAWDHKQIGSTPSEDLKENPGKTKADLKTDEEILVYLNQIITDINFYSAPENFNNSFAKDYLPYLIKDLSDCKAYLTRIGRLPEEFKDKDENL